MQKLAELAVSVMQDILGDPKVQLVPAGDAPTPSHMESEVDLAPHTRSNAAMKLEVVRALWTHAHGLLPARALAGSPSETLLSWLMEKEAELVWETDTPHDARTQWAMLCAEVLVRTNAVTGCASAPAHLCMFWGTRGASRPWIWNWTTDVRALWTHAHALLPARALVGSPSETLLSWLMEKEAELVWETDTPHDARTQWAMLCAEVLVRTNAVTGCASAPVYRCLFWGTRGASRPWIWNWTTDVRARVWRVFTERWRTLAQGWEEAPVLLSVPFA